MFFVPLGSTNVFNYLKQRKACKQFVSRISLHHFSGIIIKENYMYVVQGGTGLICTDLHARAWDCPPTSSLQTLLNIILLMVTKFKTSLYHLHLIPHTSAKFEKFILLLYKYQVHGILSKVCNWANMVQATEEQVLLQFKIEYLLK